MYYVRYYFGTLLAALLSIAVLFLLTRLMGKRQISQLSAFDYINGITIGSIAAELSLARGRDVIEPLIAMISYGLLTVMIALLSNKSLALRKIFVGKPVVLFENETLFEQELTAAKLDVNEFLTCARCQGYFNLSEIAYAILETNGTISFLPKSAYRPANPDDHSLKVEPAGLFYNLVIDGVLMPECLNEAGRTEEWLLAQLKVMGTSPDEQLLVTCDDKGTLTLYPKTKQALDARPFL